MTRWPDFFIVGAPRCGTTSMLDYLDQHPDIFMPTHLEPHFFSAHPSTADIERVRDEQEYLDLFSEGAGADRIGEKSVNYLYSEIAFRAISERVPGADILIMLRSPQEMIPSLHARKFANGVETIPYIGDALDAEPQRRRKAAAESEPLEPSRQLLYIEAASYAKHVGRYLDAFGPGQVHVILFDDFIQDTEGTYQGTLSFLGVDPSFVPEFRNVNPRKNVRFPWFHRFLFHPPPLFESISKWAIPRHHLRRIVKRARRWNLSRTERSGVPREVRVRIRDEVEKDVRELMDLLDRDLTHWLEVD